MSDPPEPPDQSGTVVLQTIYASLSKYQGDTEPHISRGIEEIYLVDAGDSPLFPARQDHPPQSCEKKIAWRIKSFEA